MPGGPKRKEKTSYSNMEPKKQKKSAKKMKSEKPKRKK